KAQRHREERARVDSAAHPQRDVIQRREGSLDRGVHSVAKLRRKLVDGASSRRNHIAPEIVPLSHAFRTHPNGGRGQDAANAPVERLLSVWQASPYEVRTQGIEIEARILECGDKGADPRAGNERSTGASGSIEQRPP